jgi:hypothetical protein
LKEEKKKQEGEYLGLFVRVGTGVADQFKNA